MAVGAPRGGLDGGGLGGGDKGGAARAVVGAAAGARGRARAQEWVREKLLKGHALHGVAPQQAVQQQHAGGGEALDQSSWDHGLLPLYVAQQRHVVRPVEWRLACAAVHTLTIDADLTYKSHVGLAEHKI